MASQDADNQPQPDQAAQAIKNPDRLKSRYRPGSGLLGVGHDRFVSGVRRYFGRLGDGWSHHGCRLVRRFPGRNSRHGRFGGGQAYEFHRLQQALVKFLRLEPLTEQPGQFVALGGSKAHGVVAQTKLNTVRLLGNEYVESAGLGGDGAFLHQFGEVLPCRFGRQVLDLFHMAGRDVFEGFQCHRQARVLVHLLQILGGFLNCRRTEKIGPILDSAGCWGGQGWRQVAIHGVINQVEGLFEPLVIGFGLEMSGKQAHEMIPVLGRESLGGRVLTDFHLQPRRVLANQHVDAIGFHFLGTLVQPALEDLVFFIRAGPFEKLTFVGRECREGFDEQVLLEALREFLDLGIRAAHLLSGEKAGVVLHAVGECPGDGRPQILFEPLTGQRHRIGQALIVFFVAEVGQQAIAQDCHDPSPETLF